MTKCRNCGFNLPLHSYQCEKTKPMEDPWTNRSVLAVLIIGLILGYLLGIWTPNEWLDMCLWGCE